MNYKGCKPGYLHDTDEMVADFKENHITVLHNPRYAQELTPIAYN